MKKFGISFAFVLLFIYAGASAVSAESYKVQEGDSLWEIADEYETTVSDLMDINELKTTVIQPKQKLTIYETYVVEKGDTLSDIAKHFDVTVGKLKKWNELDSNIIQIDQKLKINDVVADDSANEEEQSKSTEETTEQPKEKTEAKQDKEVEAEAKEDNQNQEAEAGNDDSPEGKTIEVSATAYTAKCEGCSGVTSTGLDLNANPDAKVIAVDPNVIPLGSKVYVEGYGYATAADTGGAINGNKIDVHVPTKDAAYSWGVQTVNVTIVE